MDESVERLLERVRTGDRTALQAFISRYEPRLRRRIRGKLQQMTRSIFATDDGLQEVRIRADGALSQGTLRADGAPQLLGWLEVTADRLVLNANRRAHREDGFEERFGRRPQAAGSAATSGEERDMRAEMALDRLSEPDRELFVDVVARGVPRFIAARLRGLSPAAMKHRLSRLLTRLRGG